VDTTFKKFENLKFVFLTTERSNEGKSAARWQDGSQICFAIFIWQKIAKLLITQQPLKEEKK
jgi:hypothetical protein